MQSACCPARCSCCWSLLFLQFAIAELYQRLLAVGQKVSNETTVKFCVRAEVTEGQVGASASNNPYDTHVPVFFDAVGRHRGRGRCTAAGRTVSALLAVSVSNRCLQ